MILLNYDEFYIKTIYSKEMENSRETSVYISHKEKNGDFLGLFFKNNEKRSYFYSMSSYVNYMLKKLYNYPSEKLTNEYVENFFTFFEDRFLNSFGGLDFVSKIKDDTIHNFNNLDINSLILNKEKIDNYTYIFTVLNNENREDISFLYNTSNKELFNFKINKRYEKITIIYEFLDIDKHSHLTNLIDKIRKANKFRLFFLLEGNKEQGVFNL